MNTAVKQSQRKRLAASIVAVLLAAAILLGGTYAWQSVNAQARVGAKGMSGPAGGRLHDDFEYVGDDFGVSEWSANRTANKDIYVENYESASDGRNIFVRLKLYEYMEIGAGATENPKIGAGEDNPAYESRAAKPLAEDAKRDDVTTWSPRLPGEGTASAPFSSKWNWQFGGQKSYMPTFNRDNHSEETDIKGDASDPNLLAGNEKQNATELGQPNAYAKEAGLSGYFAATAATWEAPEKYWDESLNDGAGDHAVQAANVTHTAKLTESAKVITMEQWKAAPQSEKTGNFWVVDADGWCYWANPLAPETATGLLLDGIMLQSEPDDEWYYGIYVKSEMATASDWTADAAGNGFYANENEKPSADAEALLNMITGRSA